jgi:PAS domain S-box-containing protein
MKDKSELQLFHLAMDKAPEAILWIDQKGKLVYANEKACKSLGYSQAELLNLEVFDIDENYKRKEWRSRWANLKEKGTLIKESLQRTKGGKIFPVELKVNHITHKGKEYICAFVQDISERKRGAKIQNAVYKISEAANSAENLQELFLSIHEVITELMPAKDNFYIALYDEKNEMLSFPYFVDEFEEPPAPEKLGKGLTEYVLRMGKPLLASPEVFDELVKQGEVVSIGPPSVDWLGVPLKDKGKIIGVLVVQSYTEGLRFSEEEKAVLTFISEQVALEIIHQQTEEALKENEELFRSVVENSHNGIFIVDDQYRFVYINDQFTRTFGYTHKDLIGKDFRTFLNGESKRLVARRYRQRQEGKIIPSTYEFNLVRKDGQKRRVEISSTVIRDSKKRMKSVAHLRDITESRMMEENIRNSEKLYKDLVEKADIAILKDDIKGRVIYINKTFTEIFGYTQKDLQDLRITSLVHFDDMERVRNFHQRRMEGKRTLKRYEFKGLRKDGSSVYCEVDAVALRENGKVTGSRSYIWDITKRKKDEDRIKSSLHEKEVLLREIHHRVKNNLQIISSLLNLQSGHIKDKELLRIFQESRRRVRSMAIVHEKLYQSENLSKVDFSKYLKSLTRSLFQMYGVNPGIIRLKIDVEDVFFDINTAVPCGLLVSELVSNALKHAFPKGRKGELSIEMSPYERDRIKLIVKDTGVGLQNDLDFKNAESFGLQLVDMLTQQLQGKMEVKNEGGTTFIMLFKKLRYPNKE